MCCSAKPLQQQSSVARENGTGLFSVDFRKLSTTEHSAYLRGHVLATSCKQQLLQSESKNLNCDAKAKRTSTSTSTR